MKKILAVLGFCCLFVGQASAGLIFQDDFGTGDNERFSSGSTVGKWIATQGNVEFWNFGGVFVGRAADLNGYPNVLGGIQTIGSFSFVANTSYTLSFLLGNNQGSFDNGVKFGFRNGNDIFASGEITNLRTFLSGLGVRSTVVSLLFMTQTDVEASIFFTSTGTPDNGGAIIDNVRVVPEPSTLAILALGLIGLGARRFKK